MGGRNGTEPGQLGFEVWEVHGGSVACALATVYCLRLLFDASEDATATATIVPISH